MTKEFRCLVLSSVLALGACSPAAAELPGSGITIALSLSAMDNPFFVSLKEGAEKASAELGARLVVLDARNDAANQVDQVNVLLAQGVKAIVINPVDSGRAVPAAVAAEAAGIPLVSVDRSIDSGKIASEVASDNVQGGTLAAIELGRATNGNVVHLQGELGASVTQDRGFGFEHGMNSGSIKVVARMETGFSRTRARDVVTTVANGRTGFGGVFADNDEMALGAIEALGDRAGKTVQVVGFDGVPEALQAVADGRMAATIAQQPELLGRNAVEQAVRAARGDTVRQVVDVPVRVVTRHNVAEFRK